MNGRTCILWSHRVNLHSLVDYKSPHLNWSPQLEAHESHPQRGSSWVLKSTTGVGLDSGSWWSERAMKGDLNEPVPKRGATLRNMTSIRRSTYDPSWHVRSQSRRRNRLACSTTDERSIFGWRTRITTMPASLLVPYISPNHVFYGSHLRACTPHYPLRNLIL